MTINISGILKSPQGSPIQNAEIIFEQTRTSTEVLAGTKFSIITNQSGNYSTTIGVGTFVFKVRFQDETQYRTVASNVIVTQSMNNYTLNQIIQDQSQLQDVDYDLLQDVIQARDQAQTSQTNASNSQAAAAASQTTATTKASEASTSQTSAAGSQTTATTKASEASASQTSASGSQTTATTKASEASASQTSASGSQATATTKAGEASASQTLAQKWAANPENSVVSGGLYSALHYAAKAAQAAQTANGQLVWRGGWSAQAGNPPPTPTVTTQDFYRITQAGTILSVQYEVGDYIHWDNLNSIWFKMDGTDSVTSVNGRTGAVVLAKADVGLSLVNNWGASSQTNDASTTTYATTAGVKAAYDLAATKLTDTANAVSATKLATARTIAGVQFDGTEDITLTAQNVGAAPSGYGLGTYGTYISTILGDNSLRRASGYFQGSDIAGIPTDGHTWKYVFSQAHGNATGYFGYLAIDFAGSKAWIGAQEGGTQKGPYELVKRGDSIFAGGRVEINIGVNPMLEFHIPGKHAVAQYVDANGNFRIGTSNGSGGEVALLAQLDGVGDLFVTRNGSFNDVYIRSDRRMKSDLAKLDNALDRVSKLTAYSYNKHKSITDSDVVAREVGIIAQDLRKVLPEAVKEAEDTTLTISNSAVTALLVEAIKELKDEIDQLRRIINGT